MHETDRAPTIAPIPDETAAEITATVPRLPPDWAAHVESGVSHRLGSSHADGRPAICRGLAAQARADGRIEVLLHPEVGSDVLAAVAGTRRIAYVASQPGTNRTLHLKGLDAEAVPVTLAHAELFARCRDRFIARVEYFGFSRETINGSWFDVGLDQLAGLCFTPCGAWDQSPGPGAGQAIDLLP